MSQYQSTSQFLQIAQIIKAKGLKGQFVVSSCSELFSVYMAVGLEVWVVPPSLRGVRQGLIESAEQKPGSSDFLLSISGVQDLSTASELVGRYLLASSSDVLDAAIRSGYHSGHSETSSLTHLGNPKISNAALIEESSPAINFTDIKHGNLGQLVRIDQTPAYQLWVVEGPYGELIIPAVDEYLQEASPELITLKLPKGFLETTVHKIKKIK